MSESAIDIESLAYDRVINQKKTKAEVGRELGVSPRTIGRMIERVISRSKEKAQPTTLGELIAGETERKATEEAEALAVASLPEDDDEDDEASKDFHYFVVADKKMINVTRITLDGSEAPESLIAHVGDPKYDDALVAAQENRAADAFFILSAKLQLSAITQGKVTLDPVNANMVYNDGGVEYVFPYTLANRMIEKMKNGEEIVGLMKFAERLVHNPSRKAVEELYDFLVASDIKIDDDGMVHCFKRVKADYRDCYTGTVDNTPGQSPSMPRFLVDDNENNLCSQGYHVCSAAYLPHFRGDKYLRVIVDPADFVSVPKDYYSNDKGSVKAKARVWKYYVDADITAEYKAGKFY